MKLSFFKLSGASTSSCYEACPVSEGSRLGGLPRLPAGGEPGKAKCQHDGLYKCLLGPRGSEGSKASVVGGWRGDDSQCPVHFKEQLCPPAARPESSLPRRRGPFSMPAALCLPTIGVMDNAVRNRDVYTDCDLANVHSHRTCNTDKKGPEGAQAFTAPKSPQELRLH